MRGFDDWRFAWLKKSDDSFYIADFVFAIAHPVGIT
jgi:hypothetical protein